MQLGMIGLGRMGGNIVRRLMHAGHHCACRVRSVRRLRNEAHVAVRLVARRVIRVDHQQSGESQRAGHHAEFC